MYQVERHSGWKGIIFAASSGSLTLIFCLLQLLITFRVSAQTTDTKLRVIVISENEGTVIPRANIIIKSTMGDTLRAGVTDANGFHEFWRIQPGSYTITLSFVGYETRNEPFNISAGEIKVLEFQLAETNYELDELIVAGKNRLSRVAGKQQISAADINRVPTPSLGGDLTSYLQTLPGVVTTGDRGGEMFIRGGTPSQNKVLVDNIPVIRPFHISNLFSALPQEVISTADLYAGGFSARYSGATSSILDVSLRQGNMRSFKAHAAGSPNILSVFLEGPLSRDNSSLLVSGRHSVVEWSAPSLIDQEVPILFYDFTGRFSFKSPGVNCSITGLLTYDRGRINPERDVSLSWRNTAIGSRCLGYSEGIENAVDISAGFSDYFGSEGGFDNRTRETGVRTWFIQLHNSNYLFGNAIDFGFGLDLIRYEASLDDPLNEFSGGSQQRFGDLNSFEKLDGVFDSYFTFHLEPFEHVTFSPGMASQFQFITLKPTLEPRMQAIWTPGGSEKHEINFAAGKYVQFSEGISDERDAGTVFYVYIPIESGDPLPTSYHAILGYNRQIGSKISTSLEGYGKLQKNIPVAKWTRKPGNTLRTAQADAEVIGADVLLELDFSPLYFSLGYGWSKVIYEADADELAAWLDQETFRYNPSHDRRHQVSFVSSYEFGGFEANVSWQFSSGRPFTKLFAFDFSLQNLPFQNPLEDRGTAETLFSTPFDGRLPDIHRLDISLVRKVNFSSKSNMEFGVGVINGYDARNVFYFDVNTLQQLDQTPFFPYAMLGINLN